jgi:hypothetical protein
LRYGQAGRLKELARQILVMARAHGGRRMEWDVQHARGFRSQYGGHVAHSRHRVKAPPAQGVQRSWNIAKPHRDGAIAPRIFEHMAAIRGQREIHVQAPRRLGENANLVAGSRRKQQEPCQRHSSVRSDSMVRGL